MTEKQKETLAELQSGPSLIGALLGSQLIKKGYAEKTGEPGARGQMHARITEAGSAALTA